MNSIESYLEHYFDVGERIAYFQKEKQFSAEIEVTDSCNLTCRYCYAKAVSGRGKFLEYGFLIKLVDELNANGIKEIGWIGGEPLLHRDLHALMKYTSSIGMKNVLYTNGTLVNEQNARWISQECVTGRIVIHLDSTSYTVFTKSQLKPSQANHTKILESFDLLISAGYPSERLILSIPLFAELLPTIEETMQFAVDRGVQFVNLIPLTPLGRSAQHGKFITKEEMRHVFEKRSEMLQKSWLDQIGITEYCKQFQLTDFAISHTGDVYPYVDDFRSQGNVLHCDNITQILSADADIIRLAEWVSDDTFSNKMKPTCGICEFQKYCFGNPVSREKYYVGEPDHDCWFNT